MTGNNPPKIAAILLAAGGSSRLGRPKQLLKYQGKTLIRHAAETLLASQCSNVVVVLGAEIPGSTADLTGLAVKICINKDWPNGMSSSIKKGLSEILNIAPEIDAVIIALCDQPNISASDIDRLIELFDTTHEQIVAANYNETIGVPALFSRSMFDELMKLMGDQGARSLLRSHTNEVKAVKMDAAAFDVDTAGDAAQL